MDNLVTNKDPLYDYALAEMFQKFLKEDDMYFRSMYITGIAGTGKTTSLKQLVDNCPVPCTAVAYTNKACDVLRKKLEGCKVKVQTLHVLLNLCPLINTDARAKEEVEITVKFDEAEQDSWYCTTPYLGTYASLADNFETYHCTRVIFIDEFSMVDYEIYDNLLPLLGSCKFVFIGDPKQLPPVKGPQKLIPWGPYVYSLTTVHRQDNLELRSTITALANKYPITYLPKHSSFIYAESLVDYYIKGAELLNTISNPVALCYTNKKAQEINQLLAQQYNTTIGIGDCSSRTQVYQHRNMSEWFVQACGNSHLFGDYANSYITLSHKPAWYRFEEDPYRKSKLEVLKELESVLWFDLCREVTKDYANGLIRVPGILGVANHKEVEKSLVEKALVYTREVREYLEANPEEVKKMFASVGITYAEGTKEYLKAKKKYAKPSYWAQLNRGNPLSIEYRKAWHKYLTFKGCVWCLDYTYAMTVHKSQGSTFDTVLLDVKDINKCRNKDLKQRLLYVGASRASNKLVVNG